MEKLAAECGPGRVNEELAHVKTSRTNGFSGNGRRLNERLNVRSLSDRSEQEYFEARTLHAPVDESLGATCHEEQAEGVRAAMRCLNPRQRRLLSLRYGMEGEPRTLQQIGQARKASRGNGFGRFSRPQKGSFGVPWNVRALGRPATESEAILGQTSKIDGEISTDSAACPAG